jgi:hypothetical protein
MYFYTALLLLDLRAWRTQPFCKAGHVNTEPWSRCHLPGESTVRFFIEVK